MALEVAAVAPVPEPAASPQFPRTTAEELLLQPLLPAPSASGDPCLPPLEQLLPAMTVAAAIAAAPAAANTGNLSPVIATALALAAPVAAAVAAKPAAARASGYSSDAYWDGRYEGEHKQHIQHFDWFFCYTALDALIDRACRNKELPCLHVGCGNSDLSEGMAANGSYRHIINVDISAVVIKQMQAAQDATTAAATLRSDGDHRDQAGPEGTSSLNQVAWEVADCRAMPQFEAGSFGCVIDKGTLDAVLCSASGAKDVGAYVREVHRLLAPGGAFLLITLGRPIARLGVLAGKVQQSSSSNATARSSSTTSTSSTSSGSNSSTMAVAGDDAASGDSAIAGAAAAAAAAASLPLPLLEWSSVEVLLLPKPDAYMASEASVMGRPYLGRKNSAIKADSVYKGSPVQWMGPFAPAEVEAQVAEQQLDLQEYFFAYILTKG